MSEAPRPLTLGEIEDIVSIIDPPPGLTPAQRNFALDKIRESLRIQLGDIKIVPDAISELKSEILANYEKSKISSGLTVGSWSAESQGRMIQQSTLDHFHSSGQAEAGGAGSGIDRLKELLYVTKNPKSPSMEIHFKNRQTFDSILELRKNIVKVTLKTIYVDHRLEYFSTHFQNGKFPWWYHVFSDVYDQPLPDVSGDDRFLRLYFQPRLMVEFGVTLKDIVSVLEDHKPKLYNVFVSPIEMGIVDIWPVEDAIQNVSKKFSNVPRDFAVFSFFNSTFIPKLDSFIISGIPEILDIFPTEMNMWFSFYQSEETRNDGLVKIYSHRRFKVLGPSWESVLEMFRGLGVEVVDNEPFKHVVVRAMDGEKSIDDYMKKRIRDFQKRERDSPEISGKNDIDIYFKYYYAVSRGSNLRAVLSLPYVDPRVTYTNDVLETLYVLGREAAHSVLLRELFKVMQFRDKSPVNVRHILLTVDNMMFPGKPLPNNYTGISAQGKNVISVASSEQQLSTYVNAANMGIRQDASDISTVITFGGVPKIGPNAFKDDTDYRAGITEDEIKRQLEERSNEIMNSDDVSSALDSLIAKQFSVDPARRLLVGDEDDEAEDIEDIELFDPLAAIDAEDEVNISEGVAELGEEILGVPLVARGSALNSVIQDVSQSDPIIDNHREDLLSNDRLTGDGSEPLSIIPDIPTVSNIPMPPDPGPYSSFVENISLGIEQDEVTKNITETVERPTKTVEDLYTEESHNSRTKNYSLPTKKSRAFVPKTFIDE